MTRPAADTAGVSNELAAVGDAVAAEILAALEPMQFREAVDAREREACFRLRYRAVVEMRMAAVERFPDGVETDVFDADAIHILGTDADRVIATSRIVLPVSGTRLPTEAAFELQLACAGRVAEWGRAVVDPDYRGDGNSVFMGLAAQAWRSIRARGYTTVLGATSKRLIALFEALGFSVTVLGPSRMYWGEERYPILCDSGAAIRRLEQEWLGRATDAAPLPRNTPLLDQ
jgi:N-acyl-L-homoserine lactone synthetase